MNIQSPKKILVCQQRQIGDLILTTPVLEALAKHFPEATLHVFTEEKCAPVLKNNPYIHQIDSFDKAALPPFPFEIMHYWRVARQNFDILINLQERPRCRWVSLFSNAPMRLAFAGPRHNKFYYTHSAIPRGIYPATIKLSILESLGIKAQGEMPRIFLTDDEQSNARIYLKHIGLPDNAPLITLSITARYKSLTWPMPYYVELVHQLLTLYPNAHFLPSWGPGEKGLITAFIQKTKLQKHILVQENPLTLREISACIAQAQLHIGNCTGPRHIAVAVGTPSLTILGHNGTEWTCPLPQHQHVLANLPCQPCRVKTCKHCRCLTELHPHTVTQAVKEMFPKGFPLKNK